MWYLSTTLLKYRKIPVVAFPNVCSSILPICIKKLRNAQPIMSVVFGLASVYSTAPEADCVCIYIFILV